MNFRFSENMKTSFILGIGRFPAGSKDSKQVIHEQIHCGMLDATFDSKRVSIARDQVYFKGKETQLKALL